MQFLTYDAAGEPRVGVLVHEYVHDISDMIANAPTTMIGVIEAGDELQARIAANKLGVATPRGTLSNLKLHPVIPKPGKIVCLGLNYAEHAKEGGREVPKFPTLFLRCTTSLAAHGDDIAVPKVSTSLDYEAELLIVIGKRCKNVPVEQAYEYIFGYSAFNDVTVRDYQKRTLQWASVKNFDGTGPMGPVIVTCDEMPLGAKGLTIRSVLNGKTMQEASTDDMIFDVARTIADVSEIMTLEPGDVIATGTPSGVGFARNPPVWLTASDVIRIEIDGIPPLINRII